MTTIDNKNATYSHRNSLITTMRTYELTDDSLVWQDDNKPKQSIKYSDITQVKALFYPTRVQPNRYYVQLTSRNHGHIDITNTSFVKFGFFTEQNEAYVSFINQLHQKIAQANPNLNFEKGSSWLGYIFSILVVILLVVVIVSASIFFIVAGVIWIALAKIIILISVFPWLIRYVKRNRPGNYDPFNLPSDILPKLTFD